MIKRLVYRFAFWLENRAIDLQYWAEPPAVKDRRLDLVINGINDAGLPYPKDSA